MSTSELRRGPGWWMDLDGHWNPPESWPESTPPLPGWVRAADGLWHAPALTTGETVMPTPEEFAALQDMSRRKSAPVPDVPAPTSSRISVSHVSVGHIPQHVAEPTSSLLTYAEAEAVVVQSDLSFRRMRNRAFVAAMIAGATAAMIAAGVIVLVTLF